MKKIIEKKMGAVIYVRVSSDEQVKGTSLGSQESICVEKARTMNLEVMAVFREEGESAKTTNRKVFNEALEFCRKNRKQIGVFMVWKFNRFARNMEDHFAVRRILKGYEIELVSAAEAVGTGTVGQIVEALVAGTAQLENEQRAHACKTGMQSRIKQGIWPWHPPVGYLCAHNKKHGVGKTEPDKPNPKVLPVIQMVLKSYAREIYGEVGIMHELEKKNFQKLTGIKPTDRFVHHLLADRLPFYAGLLTNPWPEKEDGGDRYLPGKHDAVISIDEMHTIQAIKRGDKGVLVTNNRNNPMFPLRRLLVCPMCGRPLTGSSSRGRGGRLYPYYHCYNVACSLRWKMIPKSLVEPAYMGFLTEVSPTEEFLTRFEKVCIAYWTEWCGGIQVSSKTCCEALRELETRRATIFEMRESGEYTSTQFAERMREIDMKISEAKLAISRLPTAEFDMKEALATAMEVIKKIAAYWDEMSPEARERFQKVAFPAGIPFNRESSFGTPKMGRIFSLNRDFKANKNIGVDLRGVGPRPRPCHGRVLPLNYRPALRKKRSGGPSENRTRASAMRMPRNTTLL
jgi:site-specific DNA recombinase